MPVGYGYQSRDNTSYVNWAQVAKGFTDVIDADIKDREARKAAYDKQDRELANTLANAPMGQYKDGNDFTANYVEAMTKQRLIDNKLFRSGRLKEKDWILKTNNAIDGTNTLFDLQKKYQEEYKTKMAGLSDGSLQAINGFNMAKTEGFADFSKTRAMLDPVSGKVMLMKMKYNEKTGIMEPTKDIVPVGTLMRNMSTNIPTFDLDAATTSDVKNMAELKTAVLAGATTAGAGSVTSYVNSPEMFEKTFPGGKAAVAEFNKYITNSVEKYLSIPHNLTSILTQNTGKYGADSFTYDKDEAEKDFTKILLTIDPNTGLPVMDKTAPNYDTQRMRAFDYAKNQILGKLDKEMQIQASLGQLSPNYKPEYMIEAERVTKRVSETGEMLAAIYAGNNQQASAARNYFKGLPNVKDVERTSTGVNVYFTDEAGGGMKTIDFKAGGEEIGVENFVDAGTKMLLGPNANLSDARKGISKYKGKRLNTGYVVERGKVTKDFTPYIQQRVSDNAGVINADDDTSVSITKLTKAYGDMNYSFSRPENKERGMVIITAPNGKSTTVNIYEDTNAAEKAIANFMKANPDPSTLRRVFTPGENPEAAAVEVEANNNPAP